MFICFLFVTSNPDDVVFFPENSVFTGDLLLQNKVKGWRKPLNRTECYLISKNKSEHLEIFGNIWKRQKRVKKSKNKIGNSQLTDSVSEINSAACFIIKYYSALSGDHS